MDLLYCILLAVISLGVKANVNTYVRTFEQPEERISTFKTVCYYPMSNTINTTTKDPLPEGFDSSLCSHVIFIPTVIDRNNRIQPATPSHAALFQKAIPVIRQQNPKLIIMVSNVGHFDPVMESRENISQFVQSAVVLLRKYNFDGLDLDWEFPGWPMTEKPHGQIHNFSIVLTELRKSFEMEAMQTNRTRLLLSAAVAATKEMAEKIYEMDYLKKALDFVNMMGYDYNGWGLLSPLTAYNSPLFPEAYDKYAFNTNNLAWSATHWGSWVGKDKLMVGIPFYCHAFKLLTSSMHGYHAIATGRGECDMADYLCVSIYLSIPSPGYHAIATGRGECDTADYLCVSIYLSIPSPWYHNIATGRGECDMADYLCVSIYLSIRSPWYHDIATGRGM
ncbi:E3.2.1.14 [Mytilus edulis]|uniref:E3.2.1.14 n=1 Tax=Mytilus edulis TaxID=6550 RepID=A0A8S3RB14_MYTED|nr:E3.2.1.14 [Mytilus edulis]